MLDIDVLDDNLAAPECGTLELTVWNGDDDTVLSLNDDTISGNDGGWAVIADDGLSITFDSATSSNDLDIQNVESTAWSIYVRATKRVSSYSLITVTVDDYCDCTLLEWTQPDVRYDGDDTGFSNKALYATTDSVTADVF